MLAESPCNAHEGTPTISTEEQPKYKWCMTWTEIIVAFTIIGMLAALLLPAQQGSVNSPKMRQCANNKQLLYQALHSYHHDAHQSFPPAYTVDVEGKPLHSWRVLVLPYLEAGDLYQRVRLDEPWDSEYNRQFHDQMPDVFACSLTDVQKGETTYQVLAGVGTYFPGTECRPLDDATLDQKNTVLLVESITPGCWMAPIDLPIATLEKDAASIRCHHRGHPNVIMADGTVVDYSHRRLEFSTKDRSKTRQE